MGRLSYCVPNSNEYDGACGLFARARSRGAATRAFPDEANIVAEYSLRSRARGMQDNKIKRGGSEFVVCVGDSEILKCASQREAENAIRRAEGKTSRRWHVPPSPERALSYFRNSYRDSD